MAELSLLEKIKKQPLAIALVDSPSVELQLAAVELKPSALSCILKPHPTAIQCALTKDGAAICYVKNPDAAQQRLALCHANGANVLKHYPEKTSPFNLVALDAAYPGLRVLLTELLSANTPSPVIAERVTSFVPVATPAAPTPAALPDTR